MYRQVGNVGYRNGIGELRQDSATIAQSGQLDALVALEHIGARLSFSRNDEVYAEGDGSDCWYKVISGAVRICKLLADGRRHIAEFCFSGDCFGLDSTTERLYCAEAVDDAIVMRFKRNATDRLIEQNRSVARLLRDAMLRDLTSAHARTLLLGRMTASERVAAFLLEMFERRDGGRLSIFRCRATTSPITRPYDRDGVPSYRSSRDGAIAIPTHIGSSCSIAALRRWATPGAKRRLDPGQCALPVPDMIRLLTKGRMPVPSGTVHPNRPTSPFASSMTTSRCRFAQRCCSKIFGFDVQSYGSGADFLADDRRWTAGCLVIDKHMPGMNGLDVVDCLQREGIRLPTILISGRLDANTKERAANLGVTKIIDKPFAARRLVELIRVTMLGRN
jgi:CRP-like cAMP-binding protein/CheY-like chemotaxis protein